MKNVFTLMLALVLCLTVCAVFPTAALAADNSVLNIALDGQPVAALPADDAVDGRAGVRLPLGHVGVAVQHLGTEHVLSLAQPVRHIHRLIILAEAVPLAGAGEHRPAVDPKPIAGIRGDVQGQRAARRQRLFTAEVSEAVAQIAVPYLLFRDLLRGKPQPSCLSPHIDHPYP